MGNVPDLFSVHEAAAELGVSPRWIQRLIKAGRAQAIRVGNQWVLQSAEVDRLKNQDRPKTGRPKKESHA